MFLLFLKILGAQEGQQAEMFPSERVHIVWNRYYMYQLFYQCIHTGLLYLSIICIGNGYTYRGGSKNKHASASLANAGPL